MTNRNVLSKIAELQGCFAKINRENKVQFYLQNTTTEEIDGNSMNSSLEINNQYGPVNAVTLALENVEGENVTLRDEESITTYGETVIVINDNPFVYTQELRKKAITELFNALNGFTYIPTVFNYKARMYLDCGDTISVENVDTNEFVTSMVLNQTIKVPATRQSTLDNSSLSDTSVSNEYVSQTEQANRHTELQVDKANQKITAVVSQIGDRSEKTTTITADIEGLQSIVSDIEDLTVTTTGATLVTLTNAIEGGKITELHIYGNNTVFKYLYVSDDTILGNDTILNGDSIIIVTDSKGNTKEYDLGIDEVLRQNGNVCDEYIYKDGVGTVIRRINTDGSIKETPTEETVNNLEITLEEGDNIFKVKNYDANISVTYVPKNDYTDTFATKVEMNSSITQTANEITLEVNKKADTDKLCSLISLSTDEINISGNRLIIDSTNFKLNKDGDVTLSGVIEDTSGNILLSKDRLYTNLIFSSSQDNIGLFGVIDGPYWVDYLKIYATIPSNFVIQSAYITIRHQPMKWGWSEVSGTTTTSKTATGYGRKIQIFSNAENPYTSLDVNSDYTDVTTVPGTNTKALGSSGKTFSSSSTETVISEDLSSWLNNTTFMQFNIGTTESADDYSTNTNIFSRCGTAIAQLQVIGYLNYAT